MLCLGINDWTNNGVAGLPAYIANMQALITTIQGYGGDVWLIAPTPSQTSYNANTADPTQGTYLAALIGLAQSNNIPLVSWYERLGNWNAVT